MYDLWAQSASTPVQMIKLEFKSAPLSLESRQLTIS
ncbi:MAG: hypothetical protein ACI8XD_001587, partial [Thermoproteota archaeon]